MTKVIYTIVMVALGIVMLSGSSSAQIDTISGVINYCTPVLGIDSCNNIIAVRSARGFATNDLVLVIQMQGAMANVGDSAEFGQVLDYCDAGRYEFATVRTVRGNTVVLNAALINHYSIPGKVQMVHVPRYVHVAVDSVTAAPWDGECGGVVALVASGNVTMLVGITATGAGFGGGVRATNSVADSVVGYRHPQADTVSGTKGEGIAVWESEYRAGRGALVDGGGGGNAKGAGGGGGGNNGVGGDGGFQVGDSLVNGGIGGRGLIYSNDSNRVFFGGGGGGGMGDTASGHGGDDGCSGGGIVILKADTLFGNSKYIEASGSNCALDVSGGGGGGGGAGGAILLDVAAYVDTISVEVRGGFGSRVSHPSGMLVSISPGGGGGGGTIWISGTTIPSTMRVAVDGGAAGTIDSLSNPDHHGAEDGVDGNTLTGLNLVGSP